MKTNIIILLIAFSFLFLNGCQIFTKVNKSKRLTKIDYSTFIGENVGDLLDSVGIPFIDTTFTFDNTFDLDGCYFTYENNPKLYIYIGVKNYEHLNPFLFERNWDLEDFRKEKIYSVRVFYWRKNVQAISEEN